MVGAKMSLLQTRQRLQALKDLGHFTGDVNAPWDAAAIDALKKAQAALGVSVDGKWGPETEDAIQKALQLPCSGDCNTDENPGPSSDAIKPMRLVGGVVAGIAIASVTAAIAVTMRWRRRSADAATP